MKDEGLLRNCQVWFQDASFSIQSPLGLCVVFFHNAGSCTRLCMSDYLDPSHIFINLFIFILPASCFLWFLIRFFFVAHFVH